MTRRVSLFQIGISACALAAAVWWGLHQHLPELPGSVASLSWITMAMSLYCVGTLLRGERWHRILLLSQVKATRAEAYSLTTVSYMGNNVLPARAGEMFRVFLLSRKTGDGLRKLLGTVVAERMLDIAVLAMCLIVVAYGILPDGALPTHNVLILIAACLALVALGAAAAAVTRHRAFGRVRTFVRPFADAPRTLISLTGLSLIAMTGLIWAVESAVYLAVARGVRLPLSIVDALYLVALANFVTALPAAPGSLGTFEAAVAFGLAAISVRANVLSYVLMLRLVLYGLITVVGLAVLFGRYGGWRLLREPSRLVTSGTSGPFRRRKLGCLPHVPSASCSAGYAAVRQPADAAAAPSPAYKQHLLPHGGSASPGSEVSDSHDTHR